MTTKIGLYRNPRSPTRPWVVRWYGEYDPATGKEKRYSKSFELKRDAEALQANQATEFRQDWRRDKPDEVTVKDFCKSWIECLTVRPETVKLYQNTVRRLLAYFGQNTLLRQITPLLAHRFIASVKSLNGKETLSSSTRHRVLRHCRTMFKNAVVWELISKNPFKNVEAPKVTTRPWHYLRPTKYKSLLDAAPSLRWKVLYALCYTAGLRKGEALSLLWGDIVKETNKETGKVLKVLVVIQNRNATLTMPPFYVKDNDARTIPLPKHTIAILEDLATYYQALETKSPYVLLDKQQYERVKVKWQKYQQQGRAWRNPDMLNNALKKFKRHIKKAGIQSSNRTLAIHTLRKSCIQNWANCNRNPETTRVLAGHSDLATTMQYYVQADGEQRAKAAAAIDDLLKETDAEGQFWARLRSG